MALRVGANALAQIKYGATTVTTVKLGTITVWSSNLMRDGFDRQDSLGLGANWTDANQLGPTLGASVSPYLVSVTNRTARFNIPETQLGTLAQTYSSYRYTAATAASDNGYIEARVLNRGSNEVTSKLSSIVLHRVNATYSQGIGLGFFEGTVTLMRLYAGVLDVFAGPIDYRPGNIARVTTIGNVHTLTLNGVASTPWTDSSNTVPGGVGNRYMGITMSGAAVSAAGYQKATGSSVIDTSPILEFDYSPTIDYVEHFDL